MTKKLSDYLTRYIDVGEDVDSDRYEKLNSVRYKSTIEKVYHYGGIIYPALDCGPPNVLARKLGIKQNTDWDLNWTWPEMIPNYRTITAFEVIEHLQNPLLFVHEVYDHLDAGGTFYLTTPVRWWMGKGKHHFAEYDEDDLIFLLLDAGFQKIEIERIRVYQLNKEHIGIRPIIRFIRDRLKGQCWFICAQKI
ncbi:MAG: class I SAM-dependent methyltransferase [Calditrichaeota bacterium]|nr:class I SAM-dependent methyltransferase [Calditrichota bacterium]